MCVADVKNHVQNECEDFVHRQPIKFNVSLNVLVIGMVRCQLGWSHRLSLTVITLLVFAGTGIVFHFFTYKFLQFI